MKAKEVYATECQKLISLDQQAESTPLEEILKVRQTSTAVILPCLTMLLCFFLKKKEIEEQKRMVTVAGKFDLMRSSTGPNSIIRSSLSEISRKLQCDE